MNLSLVSAVTGDPNAILSTDYPDSRAPQTPFAALTDQRKQNALNDFLSGILEGTGVADFVRQHPNDQQLPDANVNNGVVNLTGIPLTYILGGVALVAVVALIARGK